MGLDDRLRQRLRARHESLPTDSHWFNKTSRFDIKASQFDLRGSHLAGKQSQSLEYAHYTVQKNDCPAGYSLVMQRCVVNHSFTNAEQYILGPTVVFLLFLVPIVPSFSILVFTHLLHFDPKDVNQAEGRGRRLAAEAAAAAAAGGGGGLTEVPLLW